MVEPKRLAFISYETEGGLTYAREAKRVLAGVGFNCWLWHDDRTAGGYIEDEIAAIIKNYDLFVFICTEETNGSWGQEFERHQAHYWHRPHRVLTFSHEFVADALRIYNYNVVTEQNFTRTCEELVHDLRSEPAPPGPVTFGNEEDPL